jgi:hypothetical protein
MGNEALDLGAKSAASLRSPSSEFLAEASQCLKFCVERGHLVDMFDCASLDYAQAVLDLMDRRQTLSPAEYVRLRVDVEQARADAEHCREALLQHRREHNC